MNEKAGKLMAELLAKYARLENARNLLFEIIQTTESPDCAPNLDRLNIAEEQTPGVVADIIHAYILASPQLMPDRIQYAYDCCQIKASERWSLKKENAIAFGVLLGIFDALADIDAATYLYNLGEGDTTEADEKFTDEIVSRFSGLLTRLLTEPHDLISSPRPAAYYGEYRALQLAGQSIQQSNSANFFASFTERFETNVKRAMGQIIKLDTDGFFRSLDALSPHDIDASVKQPFLVDMILRNIGYALLKEVDGLAIAMAGRQAIREKRASA